MKSNSGGTREFEISLGDVVDSLPPTPTLWGVGFGGYATEGGFNGPGEPLNNWYEWEFSGRVEASGNAVSSWPDASHLISRVPESGVNSVFFSVEWSRVQPAAPDWSGIPDFDHTAISQYASIVGDLVSSGKDPVVLLSNIAYPAWTGNDFWLSAENVEMFVAYVERVVNDISSRLVEMGIDPIRNWVPLASFNLAPIGSYGTGLFPPGIRISLTKVARALDVALAAYIRAYDAIHAIYEKNQWGSVRVWFDSRSWSVYEFDRMAADILLARENGVARQDVSVYLSESRRRQVDLISRIPSVGGAGWRGQLGRALSAVSRTLALDPASPYAIDELYRSPTKKKVDVLNVTYDNPFIGSYLKFPGRGSGPYVGIQAPWGIPSVPAGLYWFLRASSLDADDPPVAVTLVGMANRVHNGVSFPRRDKMTRDRYIREHVFQAFRAAASGVPLVGIVYGALVDGYVWGSYEPRFGLFGVDRARGNKILSTDSMGVSSADAFQRIAASHLSGDAEGLVSALMGV